MFSKQNKPNESYSQSGEDRIIKFIFDAVKIDSPSYIDIGAHHPFKYNNTALFYKCGSRGINVEPNTNLYKEIKKHRNNDINLNIGISDKKESLKYYTMSASTLNTFSYKEAMRYQKNGYKIISKNIIQVTTISNTLNKYWGGMFPDFLTIDTEGYEEKIFRSLDLKKNYPKIICCETSIFNKNSNNTKNKFLIKLIKSMGYWTYADTYINTVFVHNSISL